jgi:hypothetical protein
MPGDKQSTGSIFPYFPVDVPMSEGTAIPPDNTAKSDPRDRAIALLENRVAELQVELDYLRTRIRNLESVKDESDG